MESRKEQIERVTNEIIDAVLIKETCGAAGPPLVEQIKALLMEEFFTPTFEPEPPAEAVEPDTTKPLTGKAKPGSATGIR